LGGWAGEMKFIRDPAERTTAATDIILALIAFGGIVFLQYLLLNSGELWKINIWINAFADWSAMVSAVLMNILSDNTR
jgi:hypothetical protein